MPTHRFIKKDGKDRQSMPQGDFTKKEAQNVHQAVNEMFEAIPKSRRMEYLGHLNDTLLFISAASKAADEQSKKDVDLLGD